MDDCNLCRECSSLCEFSAIVVLGKQVLTYPELCHSCGGCKLVCPKDAISMNSKSIGKLRYGTAGNLPFRDGLLTIGEASAVPVISRLKQDLPGSQCTIIDSPPGTACPMVETVQDVDYVLLVTEPTPFGLYDLKLTVETVRVLGKPFGILINRSDIGTDEVRRYCDHENLEILLEIVHSIKIARIISEGKIVTLEIDSVRKQFCSLAEKLLARIPDESPTPRAAAEVR